MPCARRASRLSSRCRFPTSSSPPTRRSRWMPRRQPDTSRRASPRRPSSPSPRGGASTSDHRWGRATPVARSSFGPAKTRHWSGAPPAMSDSLAYLRTPAAIRERAEAMLKYVEDGRSSWFALDTDGLEAAVQATLDVTRRRFADPALIPFHSRWRHLEAGGRDRWAALAPRLAGLPKEEIARRRMDLAVVSVLLDAGAGPDWSYREPGAGETYARSEGLGVASFHMFANGAFSRDAKGDPLRVDAERLATLTPMDIAMGFQVKAHNPLAGLEGRAGLLRRLGGVGLSRPGDLFDIVASPEVKAASILAAVLDK